jgi:anti-sigma regulatory factor (Ser/Thr protein kinase)
LRTVVVDGVLTFTDVPESVRAGRAWIAECLSGSPAADDAALMVSELFANAILYTTSGHSGGLVTVSIAIGRGLARIHAIDQGAFLELNHAAPSTVAAAPGAPRPRAGLTIVRALADEFVTGVPDKCFTVRIAGPAQSSPLGGPGGSDPGFEHWAGI